MVFLPNLAKKESEAIAIIEIFEDNYPIPTSLNELEDKSEEIMLYLAAKKYMQKTWITNKNQNTNYK